MSAYWCTVCVMETTNTGNLHTDAVASPLCHCGPAVERVVRDGRVAAVVVTHR